MEYFFKVGTVERKERWKGRLEEEWKVEGWVFEGFNLERFFELFDCREVVVVVVVVVVVAVVVR